MHHSFTVPVAGAFVVAFSVSHNAIPLLGITTSIMIRLPAGTASVVGTFVVTPSASLYAISLFNTINKYC